MADEAVYAVVLPLQPLRVGTAIDRAAWPLHVTLVPDVRTCAGLDLVVAVVREAARRIPVLTTMVLEPAWFGPNRDVLVDLVDPVELQPAHEALLGALERHAGAEPVVPAYHRDGNRPHVTVSPLGRAHQGERLTLDTVALVEIGPDQRMELAAPVAAFPVAGAVTPEVPATMEAASVAEICTTLTAAGIRHWVIGGWGVDALAGAQSRPHHDLDLFVDVDDLDGLLAVLGDLRMTVRHLWSESRRLAGSGLPSAFVADGPLGELDVHVVATRGEQPIPLSESTVVLPAGALVAVGTIGGSPVRCATVEAQLVMHSGYELPATHRADVERLRLLAKG